MSSVSKLIQIKNITLLFIIAVILSFSATLLYLGMEDKKEFISEKINLQKTKLELEFTKQLINLEKKYLKDMEKLVYKNEKIIEAFISRDRKELDKLAQPYFDSLIKENSNFEVLCFGLPDSKAFYRAHMPSKFEDDISLVQGVSKINSSQKEISGFMISKLGVYYRLTYPVFNEGKYVGFIAFGINLNYVNDFIKSKFETQSAILVETKVLKKSKWYEMLEEGEVGRYTVISTNGDLVSKLPSSTQIATKNKKVKIDNQHYSLINDIKIKDIIGKEIATVVLFQNITEELNGYNYYLYTFCLVLFLIIVVLSYVLIKTFNRFLSTIILINDDLKELNTNLESRVKEEVEKNREKEKQLFEQAKRAQIGEMIGNIAHQWRQPLSGISTTSSAILLKKEMGVLSDDDLEKNLGQVIKSTEHLSNTINDFRDFVSGSNYKEKIKIKEQMEKSLGIVKSTLEHYHIDVQTECKIDKDFEIEVVSSSLSQVVLNIINNAKDALVQRDILDKKIFIQIEKNNQNIVLSIEDNAGGISKELMPKIFDPYFTTKHQSQGTGIGLYMCNDIVTKVLNGKLSVSNGKNGAIFKLELPI